MSESSEGSSPLAFGQVVIGPPGSGKTTYCHGMQEFLGRVGRAVAVVNLDPANEGMPYSCAVDISELITLTDVMENLKLGPNGGLIYCMEYLEANFDWLQEKLAAFRGHYYLFDCPGQVELYTHHDALKNVFAQLAKWNFRVGSVLCGHCSCAGGSGSAHHAAGPFWVQMWLLTAVFFTVLLEKGLPKEAVGAPSLQAFKARLDVALGRLGCRLATLHIAGGWNWMSTVVLCNPGHSMSL